MTELSYCAQEVRRHAPDRYLGTLFAPAEVREALFALYAFDHEIGKVRRMVSEPMAGLIRLQWWRDSLDEIMHGRTPAHPVAQGLARAFNACALQRHLLENVVDARERDLEDDPSATLAALEERLRPASAAISDAALQILSATSEPALEAGRSVGLARGLAEALWNLVADARRGRILLPAEELRRHGITVGDLTRDTPPPVLAEVVQPLTDRAREHIRTARQKQGLIPGEALPALLPAVVIEAWLGRLRRAGYDPFRAGPLRTSPTAVLRLLLRRAMHRF